MKISVITIFSLFFLLLEVATIGVYTSLNISSFAFLIIIDILIIVLILLLKPKYFNEKDDGKIIWPVKLYLFWNVICITRGIFVAENYWEWKNLFEVGVSMLLPLFIYVATNKLIVQQLISFWLKYALLLLFFFLPFDPTNSFVGFYLAPLLLLLLTFPLLSLRWKMITLFFLFMVFFAAFDARSNIIRFSMAGLLGVMYYFRAIIPQFSFKMMHKAFILLPIILLLLGLTNTFNIFKIDDYIKGDYTVGTMAADGTGTSSLTADTRTFLYVENIESALKNDYVLLGRTPANGYDSVYFGDFLKWDLHTGKQQRFTSEVGVLNVFTWTGLIGVVLYFLVFLKATHLAIYRSNNYFIKIIGLFVAFRWFYAFVEDFTKFDIQYVFLWVLIGMCYSTAFRQMTDIEFKEWTKGLFKGNILNVKIRR